MVGRDCRGSINDTSTVVILAGTISMKRRNSRGEVRLELHT